MELELGRIYQLKKSYIKTIENDSFPVMHHVNNCGNRFKLISVRNGLMRCNRCGHTYDTSMSRFSEIYELAESIKSNDPNVLFKRKQ